MSRTVIAAAVASLVLAGCTGSTEPAQPPTSEDALTTTSPATEEVAVTSEAAPTTEEAEETEANVSFAQTEEGAEEFVTHYLNALDEAFVTGSTEEVLALSTENCDSCRVLTEDASSNPAGQSILRHQVESAVIVGETARVDATVTEAGSTTPTVFELVWRNHGWLTDAIKMTS